MKTYLITTITLLYLAYANVLLAQDTIVEVSGIRISAKVLDVSQDMIKYYNTNDAKQEPFFIPRKSVMQIIYENGEVLVIKAPSLPTNSKSKVFSEAYLKGKRDAYHYKDYKTAGGATLVSTLIASPLGLVCAIATSATRPSYENLEFPDRGLIHNEDYKLGYAKQAHRIKSGRVWKNFAIGLSINLLVYFTFFNQ